MLLETIEPNTLHTPHKITIHQKVRYLFHPAIDFFCLGGGSLLIFVFVALFAPFDTVIPAVSTVMFAIAILINFPHFAHSYQIFYQNFFQKSFQQNGNRSLQIRYIIAGILIPSALTVFFAASVILNDPKILGFGGTIMLFLVGWHYVKQGYGMLIVDSVLKKRYFTDYEKKVLLINAYICWVFFWLLTNWTISEENFLGLEYVMFTIPSWIIYVGGSLTTISTAIVAFMLIQKKFRDGIHLPFNGTVAYFTSLYVWLGLRLDPFFLILIPACHSLQYLIVVWRYQLNSAHHASLETTSRDQGILSSIFPSQTIWKFIIFVITGILLGYAGFLTIPQFLDSTIDYDHTIFGESMFLFMFLIFINVHHYFMDNVIWRKENPDTRRFLFGPS